MINFFLISNNFKINYNYGTSFTERDSREHMEWRVPRIPTPKSEKCEWFFATLSEVCILYLIARYQIKIDDCWNCRFISTVIRKAALNISIGCRIVSVASKLAWLAFGLRSNIQSDIGLPVICSKYLFFLSKSRLGYIFTDPQPVFQSNLLS